VEKYNNDKSKIEWALVMDIYKQLVTYRHMDLETKKCIIRRLLSESPFDELRIEEGKKPKWQGQR